MTIDMSMSIHSLKQQGLVYRTVLHSYQTATEQEQCNAKRTGIADTVQEGRSGLDTLLRLGVFSSSARVFASYQHHVHTITSIFFPVTGRLRIYLVPNSSGPKYSSHITGRATSAWTKTWPLQVRGNVLRINYLGIRIQGECPSS